MALDRNAFISNFLDELLENSKLVDSSILILKKDVENEEELNKLLRCLHTIKGSSRMLKFHTLEKIAHGLENVFKGVKEKRLQITKPVIQLVFISTDYLRFGAELIKNSGEDSMEIHKLLQVYDKAYGNEPFSLEGLKSLIEAGPLESQAARAVKKEKVPDKQKKGQGMHSETIRIKISKVNKIVKLLNNLIIRQFQFKKQNEVLSELEQKFIDLLGFAGEMKKSSAFEKKHTECLKMIQQVRKNFLEQLPLLERNTFKVQEEILSLRMLPLNLIMGSLGKMVEETSMQIDKEIDFEISGTDILIDKMILEKINDPIIHIVRNAVDHGIEEPDERERRGKSRVGRISITCSTESGSIIIRIRDDGGGVDYDKLRKKAITLNPHQEEEIEAMENSALNVFLFQAGFSTKESISNLSGRGVGLDIVRVNIEMVKGKITLSSEKGQGTEFVLALPLSLATVEGFFVTSAEEKFLIPSNFVKELTIITEDETLDLLNKKAIKLRDKIIPVYHLSDILGKAAGPVGQKMFVLVVETMGEMVGIIVESVIQYSSLVYKPLPASVGALKVIQGIVFDESFNIVNILYVPEIVKRFKGVKNIDSKKRFSSETREFKHVLIVDDSYSTREIEKSILEFENYNVETAVDGINGLEKVKERYFHLIITDIEMPRMDGLTFIENLRKDEKYKNTPVIVVSSKYNYELKEQFKRIGVTSYIIKSDFDRGNLLEEVKKLIG